MDEHAKPAAKKIKLDFFLPSIGSKKGNKGKKKRVSNQKTRVRCRNISDPPRQIER